ncbi:MAG TPA: hypothetical protein VM915_04810 [Verrucomicrobiae bacterium]|jgi:hypothetical protein|nr:hypothetical protein [Verrucomicrobiae bacterium]
MRALIFISALALAACSPPAEQAAPEASVAAAPAVDPAIAAVVSAAMPGVTIVRGESDGEGEFEVTGTLNGQEYEFDLMGPDGGWRVTEIQRDIAWADTPEAVRAVVTAAPNAFEPARVIESRQLVDTSVVYIVYALGADTPVMEVRLLDGEAAILPPAH